MKIGFVYPFTYLISFIHFFFTNFENFSEIHSWVRNFVLVQHHYYYFFLIKHINPKRHFMGKGWDFCFNDTFHNVKLMWYRLKGYLALLTKYYIPLHFFFLFMWNGVLRSRNSKYGPLICKPVCATDDTNFCISFISSLSSLLWGDGYWLFIN